MCIGSCGVAQNDFIGIAKYKITAEGGANPVTDSMSIIFDRQKVKIILYLPPLSKRDRVSERIFIDDFTTKKSMVINTETKTYTVDALKTGASYDFFNTSKIAAANNNLLCFQYVADSNKINRSTVLRAECLASIDYRNSLINNYFFLGVQPVIIDNRLVMDFTVTQVDGIKQKIFISDIKKMDNVDSYFTLDRYKQVK